VSSCAIRIEGSFAPHSPPHAADCQPAGDHWLDAEGNLDDGRDALTVLDDIDSMSDDVYAYFYAAQTTMMRSISPMDL
jgi:hypothetical protein